MADKDNFLFVNTNEQRSYDIQENMSEDDSPHDMSEEAEKPEVPQLRRRERHVQAPPKDQKLGWLDIFLLFMNRTIGSGLFVGTSYVLRGTGSAGAALCLWAAGAVVSTCGLLVWLELGLTLPLVSRGGQLRSMPRSGGEKNYLEAIFPNPKFLTTCMYGTVFVILGNLAGNSIACAHYIMEAAGTLEPTRGEVIGIALGILSLSVILHVCSRRGGIIISHIFGVLKILLLITMIGLGFASANGHTPSGGKGAHLENFHNTFSTSHGRNWASYVDSFFYVIYAYSGFQQPFYVLAECRTPRKTFPRATLTAMAFSTTLFLLLNAAYYCVVPLEDQFNNPTIDMATLFFQRLFGAENETARRVMAGLIAGSIFGGMLVMTFTASRVKQEIAKEGIWPCSLFFASDRMTPVALIKRWLNPHSIPEYSPIPALWLHWLSSVTLVLVTATYLDPNTAYSVLVNVYSYVIRVGMGFTVSGALLFQYVARRKTWNSYNPYKPWIGRLIPIPAIVEFLACGFLLFAAFAKPSENSPFSYAQSGIEWFIIPAIGQSAWIWGIIWWLGLWGVQLVWNRRLQVTREPVPVLDPDDCNQYIMDSETVSRYWVLHRGGRSKVEDDYEIP